MVAKNFITNGMNKTMSLSIMVYLDGSTNATKIIVFSRGLN